MLSRRLLLKVAQMIVIAAWHERVAGQVPVLRDDEAADCGPALGDAVASPELVVSAWSA